MKRPAAARQSDSRSPNQQFAQPSPAVSLALFKICRLAGDFSTGFERICACARLATSSQAKTSWIKNNQRLVR
jgi:hypothetical protein